MVERTPSGPSSLPAISLAGTSAGRSSSELRRRFYFRGKRPLNGPGDETCISRSAIAEAAIQILRIVAVTEGIEHG